MERFNSIASSHAIPKGVFRVNKGYRILFTCKECTQDGPRVLLFIDTGERTMVQIYLPIKLTSSFNLLDIWEINDRVRYKLFIPEIAGTGAKVFELERQS
jgi:hypothetical protein